MGTIKKFGTAFCDICNNEKMCIDLSDSGIIPNDSYILICEDCLNEALDLLKEE